MKNGFLRIASAAPAIKIADVDYNVSNIIETVNQLKDKGVEVIVFPELCVTGYTCGDLFHSSILLENARNGLEKLKEYSKDISTDFIVGLPVSDGRQVWNCAALIQQGTVSYVRKHFLPNYNEFYERRWFSPASKEESPLIFESHGVKIGIEICEDLWVTIPPSCKLALAGAEVIFNLSASDDLIGKYEYTLNLIKQQSARCFCAYAYASSGRGESSTDLVYSPKTIISENGILLAANDRWDKNDFYVISDVDIEALRRDRIHVTTFSDCATYNDIKGGNQFVTAYDDNEIDFNHQLTFRTISAYPFVPANGKVLDDRCQEIVSIQSSALQQRLSAINCGALVVGISGGLDSTLALLVAVNAFDALGLDRKGIYAVTMPGFGTTNRTYNNAKLLIENLGVSFLEISIEKAVIQHFKDISHNPGLKDVTYENSQARERTQILMDIANQQNGIVLGTGDMSELALGWATYNGDHMSMYGINAGIPKTLVKYLVGWFASRTENIDLRNVLNDILDTPISPELIPGETNNEIDQKTEDIVGPYELHDFYLYYTLRYGFSPVRIEYLARMAFEDKYSNEVIRKWLKVFVGRFFSQQFKRSCLPDGPKVGSVCLSPRGDWRMPSDASAKAWFQSLD